MMKAIMIAMLLAMTGCTGMYKTTYIRASAQGNLTIHGQTENLTEGGVSANAKANGIENAGINQ